MNPARCFAWSLERWSGYLTGTDQVLELLRAIARESYPRIFEPDDGLSGFHSGKGTTRPYVPTFGKVTTSRDATEALLTAMRADKILRPLADGGELGVFVSSSTGIGWRVQPENVAQALVGSAAHQVIAKARGTAVLAPLLEELNDVLAALRGMVAGDTVNTLMMTAFEGLELPQGTALATPWGELRPASQAERRIQPFEPAPPTAMLISVVPTQLRLGEPPDSPDLGFMAETSRFGD